MDSFIQLLLFQPLHQSLFHLEGCIHLLARGIESCESAQPNDWAPVDQLKLRFPARTLAS